MITIYLLPALYGDSILLDITQSRDQVNTNILVDCGFNFSSQILPLLKEYNENGKVIDRFIVTHYDDDHIRSAAKFINQNGVANNPNIIPIKQVWLNAYRHIQFDKQKQPTADEKQSQLLENFMNVHSPANIGNDSEIGAKQASKLGKELYEGKYPWNEDFGKMAVCIENNNTIPIKENITLRLLGPNKLQLEALGRDFIAGLKEMGIEPSEMEFMDDAFELYSRSESKKNNKSSEGPINGAAIERITIDIINYLSENSDYKPDSAPGNGSSIAFVLEADNKKILMLADAHAEPIIEQLKILYPDQSTIFFDAVKIAHHGSIFNNPKALFDLIDSPVYMISTNGSHPSHVHPDLQTLAFIINRPLRGDIKCRKLVFNYYPAHLTELFDVKLSNHFNYSAEVSNLIQFP